MSSNAGGGTSFRSLVALWVIVSPAPKLNPVTISQLNGLAIRLFTTQYQLSVTIHLLALFLKPTAARL